MTRADALRELLAAVDAGTVSRGWFDQRHWPSGLAASLSAEKAYNGSVDAAIAFVDAVLPDWGWHIKKDEGSDLCYAHLFSPDHRIGPGGVSRDDNGASALLIATLKALIAQEDKK